MPKLKNGPLTSLSDVPEQFHELYEQVTDGEHSGKYVLSGVETGWKQTDALNKEAGKWRLQLKDAKTALDAANIKIAAFGDLSADEVKAKLDRIAELEESAKGKVPEAKLNELAEQRANAKMAPLQRELQKAKEDLDKSQKTIGEYKTQQDTAKILDHVRTEASKLGIDERSYATPKSPLSLIALNVFKVDESGEVVAREDSGFTVGLPPSEVMPQLLEANPFFVKPSEGSGSLGSHSTLGARGASVFASSDLTVRFQLQKSNPTEYQRQWKAAQASGLSDEFGTLKPKNPAQ